MKSHPSLLELAADVFRSKKKQRDRKDGGGSRTSAPSPPPPLHHVSFERSAEAGRSFMFRRRGERSSCKQNNKEDHLIGDNGAKTRMMWDGRERWPSTSSLPPIVAMQQQQNPTSMTTSMMLLISRKHSAQHSGKSVKGN